MFSFLKKNKSSSPSPPNPTYETLKKGVPVQTNYTSAPVPIPDDFLAAAADPPPDAVGPVTITPIDWARSPVPENDGLYAVVLENVLSPSECETLLRMAEASAAAAPPAAATGEEEGEGSTSKEQEQPKPLPFPHNMGANSDPWKPALVNIGMGYEVLTPDYRNSDRIIWDEQTVVDRIWERCLLAPGLRERLMVLENEEGIYGWRGRRFGGGRRRKKDVVVGASNKKRAAGKNKKDGKDGKDGKEGGEKDEEEQEEEQGSRWEFRRANKRMRFLRYGKGGFFRPHCDAPYGETDAEGRSTETLFTLHLYLNDSKAEAADPSKADLIGGATDLLSGDEKRKVAVHCKAGRVLIFQHMGVLHSGADVYNGVKYTMRTDLSYEMVRPGGAA